MKLTRSGVHALHRGGVIPSKSPIGGSSEAAAGPSSRSGFLGSQEIGRPLDDGSPTAPKCEAASAQGGALTNDRLAHGLPLGG